MSPSRNAPVTGELVFLRGKSDAAMDCVCCIALDGKWETAREAQPATEKRLRHGAQRIPVRAADACLVLHRLDGAGRYRAILLDPGYLAPEGVRTALECVAGKFESAQDAVSGKPLPVEHGRIAVDIPRGAFRIVDLQIR